MTESIVFTVLQDVVFLALLMGGGWLFGRAFYRIYKGEPVFAKKLCTAAENGIYKAMGVDPREEMSVKRYALGILFLSGISLIFFMAVVMLQAFLAMNPEKIDGMSWHLAFNTAVSFVTNTNWQAYSGETGLSYFSQMICLTTQNFLSGAVGIAVLFALVRGFTRRQCKTIGNCWADITRITLFMLPVSFAGALVLVSQGVPQTMSGSVSYIALNGEASRLYLGPAASQIIIKQLFTNGGGFFGVNSAYPFENPTPFSNLLECLSLLWIPVGLCFTFGKAVKNRTAAGACASETRDRAASFGKKAKALKSVGEKDQGVALLKAMTIIFLVCLAVCTAFEFIGAALPEGVKGVGNMEGKEVRFGIGASSLWATATTAASNGSVNAMHDSFTSIGGMIPMFLMMLGEIIYGGVGCGLYGMIAFALLTVFIAGLMVGRTPEYLGKKIGGFDMKMVCLIILIPVLCLLLGAASTVLLSSAPDWLTNGGAHGFSEILYAFASMAGNNGSAFAGFNANTPWTNVVGGVIMLLVRFVPLLAALGLAGSLANKKSVPQSDGTLATNNAMFVGLLIAVVLIIGALSFFPALALGPIAEFVG